MKTLRSNRLGLLVSFLAALARPAAAQTPFTHQGVDARHSPYGLTSGQVDPASGNLTIVATDLVLPGNAGFDLAIQRVYNSSVFPDYSDGQSTVIEEDSWAGIGWKLHFGRVLNPTATGGGETQIEMGDGSRHALYSTSAHPDGWITTGFWVYNKGTHTLKLPNGLVYVFGRQVFLNARLGTVRYVTEIRDPFNNRITFSYFDASGPPDGVRQIRQHLSATDIREVNFTYDGTFKALASMAYNGRTWLYFHAGAGPAGHSVLVEAQLPLGPQSWKYAYGSGLPGELTAVTAPSGGKTTYTYQNATRRAGPLSMLTRVVSASAVGGSNVTPGTWTFAYGQGANQDTTVISCPCGTTTHRFYGTGLSGTFTGWSAGTLVETTVEENGTVLERRTMAWTRSEQISSNPIPGVQGVWADSAVYKPLLAHTTVTRGPQSWTTYNDYGTGQGTYNDYGQPWRIREVGETPYQTRTTTRNFRYGFAPYIVNRIAVESVLVRTAFGEFAAPVDRSWAYNLATGFLTSQTVGGVTTSFEPTAQGNVGAVTDARNNRTTLAYSWGAVQDIQTPNTHLTLGVNSEGLAVSATNHTDVPSTYVYDPLFRPAEIRRTGTDPILFQYENIHANAVWVRRGTALTQHQLDGFGRSALMIDSVGLKTRSEQDACGRLTFQYAPYTAGTGSRRTAFQYDALGRVTRVTDPAGGVTQFLYTSDDVTRIDPAGRSTRFDYLSFGEPGSERLASVRDASGTTTSYAHDGHGNLTKVVGPTPGLTRTWTRNQAGQVLTETQPESGTTTYTYDAAGNLTVRTDAKSQTTTYAYDSDNRLVTRNAPGTSDDLTIVYSPSGRVHSLSGGGTTTTFQYDTLGRLTNRADVTGALTFTSGYSYNTNDDLIALTYPSGRVVTYEYVDTEHRLTRVKQNGLVFAHTFTYDDAGRPAGYTTGAVTHTFTYDLADRTKRILAASAGGTLDLTYTYDPAGNVQAIADPRPGAHQSFTVDPLDRLASAAGPWGQLTWTYDAAGNRLAQGGSTPVSYTYQGTTQRLTASSGAMAESFTYDAVGQLTSDSRGQYTYSPLGRLASTTRTGLTASYAYDAAGLRQAKTVNGHTSYTIRGASGETLSEYAAPCSTPVWAKDTIYAGGRALGAVRATAQTPTVAMSTGTQSVGEAAGTVSVSFVLTTPGGGPLPCAVTAAFDVKAGTALAGSDFTAQSGTVTFAAGSPTLATRSTAVSVLADTRDEANETFVVDLSSVSGGAVGTPSRTTVTITDDDVAPALSISNVTQYEGHSGTTQASFTVSLSAVSGQPVQVAYASANGTATAGSDYQAVAGTLTIPAGASSGVIAVPVYGDGAFEANETFLVNLSAPVNATLADGQGLGTLLNDDAARMTWGDFYAPRDGSADAALLAPATGVWTFKDSNTGTVATAGPFSDVQATDIPVPADYTGDGITDCALYRPATGRWTVAPACLPSGHYSGIWGGQPSDVPVPADYNGDGRADLAVYRRATNVWHVAFSTGGSMAVEWGWNWTHVIPVPGDYDGDGRADLTYYAGFNGSWWVLQSSTGTVNAIDWGVPGGTVIPVPGDYDGDGRTDRAYFSPATAGWYLLPSTTGVGQVIGFGNSGMIPVQADYDGDGKTDLALYDPPNRHVWVRRSTTGTTVGISMLSVSQPGALPVLRKPQ